MSRAAALLLGVFLLTSCQQKVIEYREVPDWARQLGAVESSHTEDDGTEVRWVHDVADKSYVATGTIGEDGSFKPGAPPPGLREETLQGPVLHCALPMSVVANLRECMVNEEYDLVWEQLLSQQQRDHYEAGGEEGRAAFELFLTQARKDLVTCLRRMEAGNSFGDVKRQMLDSWRLGLWLHPRVQGAFPIFGIEIVRAQDDSTLRFHDLLIKKKRK